MITKGTRLISKVVQLSLQRGVKYTYCILKGRQVEGEPAALLQ